MRGNVFNRCLVWILLTMLVIGFTAGFVHGSTVLSVDEAIKQNDGNTIAWVEGYIVGVAYKDVANNKALYFLEPPFTNQENIVLADDFNERNEERLLPVRFENLGKDIKDAVNLAHNPNNFRKSIQIRGKLGDFFAVPGMRSPSDYRWLPLRAEHRPPTDLVRDQEDLLLTFTVSGGKGGVTGRVYHKSDKSPSFSIISFSKEDRVIIPGDEVYRGLEYFVILQDEESYIKLPEGKEESYRVNVLLEEKDHPGDGGEPGDKEEDEDKGKHQEGEEDEKNGESHKPGKGEDGKTVDIDKTGEGDKSENPQEPIKEAEEGKGKDNNSYPSAYGKSAKTVAKEINHSLDPVRLEKIYLINKWRARHMRNLLEQGIGGRGRKINISMLNCFMVGEYMVCKIGDTESGAKFQNDIKVLYNDYVAGIVIIDNIYF